MRGAEFASAKAGLCRGKIGRKGAAGSWPGYAIRAPGRTPVRASDAVQRRLCFPHHFT